MQADNATTAAFSVTKSILEDHASSRGGKRSRGGGAPAAPASAELMMMPLSSGKTMSIATAAIPSEIKEFTKSPDNKNDNNMLNIRENNFED